MAQAPTQAAPPADTLTVDGSKGSVRVEASGNIFETLVELWRFTLDWVGDHPIVFCVFLGFLTYNGLQERRLKAEMARMKLEYDAKRQAAKPVGGAGRKTGG